MKEYIDNAGFYITDDPTFMEKEHGITDDLLNWINRLHLDVLKSKPGTADRLIKLIGKHPRNPQLKNLLVSYYHQTNQSEKAFAFNRKAIEAHPNYFFSKLNLANEYMTKEEYDKVPEVLGENFDLKEMYPERDTFHISEVMSMYKFAVIYYAYTKDFETAHSFLEQMKEIDEDDMEVKAAEEILYSEIFNEVKNNMEGEVERSIDVDTAYQNETLKTDSPEFNHPEIKLLYQQGIDITSDVIDQILNLPRTTLIEDLVTVLNDGIERFTFFENQGWEEEKTSFIFHAINLLTELNAVEQLPAVLNTLRQSDDYLEFFINDFLTECIWMSIYKLGENQLNTLENFMKEPAIYTYCRSAVSEAIAQILIDNKERRNEVIQWYAAIFEFYKNADIVNNVIDSDLIGLMIADVVDLKGVELLPEITALFKLNYVSIGICGDLEAVKHDINSSQIEVQKREILTMKEMYHDILTTWAGNFNEEEDSSPSHFDSLPQESPFNVQKTIASKQKVGRNDPCPCGSGKKYKKCCL